jgi:hypothetical protein
MYIVLHIYIQKVQNILGNIYNIVIIEYSSVRRSLNLVRFYVRSSTDEKRLATGNKNRSAARGPVF